MPTKNTKTSNSKRSANNRLTRRVFKKSGGRCSITGKLLTFKNRKTGRGRWEVDHNIPYSAGGTTTLKNLSAVSTSVNQKKGDMTMKEFIKMNRRRKCKKKSSIRCQFLKRDRTQCKIMARTGMFCGRHKWLLYLQHSDGGIGENRSHVTPLNFWNCTCIFVAKNL